MSAPSLLNGWPDDSAMTLLALRDGTVESVATQGDATRIREWASVSKLAVALAVGVEKEWRFIDFDLPLGPQNSTAAHLLSHSSGVGIDATAPMQPLGHKRVYSSYGYDLLIQRVVGQRDPFDWLNDRCLSPLGMADVTNEGSLAAGLRGSLRSLEVLATAWLRGDLLSPQTFATMTTPYLAHLDGVVPGFGSFSPCPWGLGPEIKGTKEHWMGSAWSPRSYGHFGKSGAMVLVDPDAKVALAALSAEPFGPWAVKRWSEWTNEMHARMVGH